MTYKNEKRILSLILAIVIVFASIITFETPSLASDFSDIDNHWAKSYIETASSYKTVSGYPDNTFKPNDNIKRIEFIAMIVNSQDLDVRARSRWEYWGQAYIQTALENDLITYNEYGDMDEDTFNKNITREEMASIVVNAYINSGFSINSLDVNKARASLNDFNKASTKYYESAISSVALDFITGYPDKTFLPKQYATRAEATILSYRLMVKLGIISANELAENIVISNNKLEQGDVLTITIYHAANTSLISLVQDLYPDFKWYDNNGLIQGYIPTNYSTKAGLYSLNFTNTKTGNLTTKNIEVLSRDFRVQHLKVDSSIESNTRTDAAYEEYRKYFNPSRDISSPVKYYTESFLLPNKGRLTTEFGETRSVNGSMTTYRHSGLDIAAPRGTDVVSTNSGKVTLAMSLTLTGNTIVIDHGQGLFSVYFHLDKLFVSNGELVTRGQVIGAVGSTGFSTGPHLHFTMSYYRTNIEPGHIIYGKSVTKSNYLQLMK
ncbi:MAG: peptidoglycan DD-metalloendopeptidase family protein [Gudongella sp.]|nr:peptidoglycan DD-metalloendopeptidase family protein [Gudongella sp.]